ncbi:MAG: LysR family transcriptional regulator [Lachnospiraceae bacterium]|nr:LysR family transcriptional regulator [Lachnospiraceae bacterium]
MSVSYEHYKIFYYVGKYKSFSKAAKALNNSQPNITRTMNNLETELGCRLFIRSNKGIVLTSEGEKLFLHVQAAHEQIQIGEAKIASSKNLYNGRISIGFSIGITEILLHDKILPVLRDYHLLYPGTHIQIINHSTPSLVSDVSDGLIDMAVVTAFSNSDLHLHETILNSFQDILIAGPSFSHLKDKILKLADLVQYPIINLWQGTETFEFYKKIFHLHGLPFEPEIETATTDQVLSFVSNDMGIGFISPEYAKSSLQKGEVFQINLAENIPIRNISLIYDIRKPVNIAADILRDMICNARADPV